MSVSAESEEVLLAMVQPEVSDVSPSADGNCNLIPVKSVDAINEARLLDLDSNLAQQSGEGEQPQPSCTTRVEDGKHRKRVDSESTVEADEPAINEEQIGELSDGSEIPFGGLTIAAYEPEADEQRAEIDTEQNSPSGVELTIDEDAACDEHLFGDDVSNAAQQNGDAEVSSKRSATDFSDGVRSQSQCHQTDTYMSSACTSQREYDSDAFVTQYAGERLETATPTSSHHEISIVGMRAKRTLAEAANRIATLARDEGKKARTHQKDDGINLADDEDTEIDMPVRSSRVAPFRVPHSATLHRAAALPHRLKDTSERERKPRVSGPLVMHDLNADDPIEISDDERSEEKADVQMLRVSRNKRPLMNTVTVDKKRDIKSAVRSGASSQFGSVSSLTSLSSIDPSMLTRSVLEQHVRVIRDLSRRRVVQQALTKFLALVKLPAPNDIASSWIREAIDTASSDLLECLLASNQHAAVIKTLSYMRHNNRMTDKCFDYLTRFEAGQKDAIVREKQSLLHIVTSELDTVSFSAASLRRLFVVLRLLLFASLLDAAWRIVTECGAKMMESRILDGETLDRLVTVTSQTANLDILMSAVRFFTRLTPDALACVAPQSFANLQATVQRFAPVLLKDVTKLADAAAAFRNRVASRKVHSNVVSGDSFAVPSRFDPNRDYEAFADRKTEADGDAHFSAARPFTSASFRPHSRLNEARALVTHSRFEQLAAVFADTVCAQRVDVAEYEALIDILLDAFQAMYSKEPGASGVTRTQSLVRSFFSELVRNRTIAVAYDATAKVWFRVLELAVEQGDIHFIGMLFEIGSRHFTAVASAAFMPQLNTVYRAVFDKLLRADLRVVEAVLEMQRSTPLLNGLVVQPTVIRQLVTHCVNIELDDIKQRLQRMKDAASESRERHNSPRELYSKTLHFLYEWATKANIYPLVRQLTCADLSDRFVMRVYNDLTAEETFVILCEFLSRFYVCPSKNDATEVLVMVDFVGRQRDRHIDTLPMLIRPDKTLGDFSPNDYRLNTVLNLRMLLADSRFVKSVSDVRYAIRSMLLPNEQPCLYFFPAKLSFTQSCVPFRSGTVLLNDPMER